MKAERIKRPEVGALIAEAEEAAKMRGINDALIPSQVPQFQRGLDAILGLPKLRAQLKGLSQ